ncbi:STAS domain-containing protein [Streptomyces lonarensis]|uniref:Anti-sigma factor antagonist n=1 Tax=Streptomyces lonarensis TaxID=700599 RepID=A0A7X6CZZ6_9ACTN|nr:STAS domain-containing protein [Streptomyces lonarensis]
MRISVSDANPSDEGDVWTVLSFAGELDLAVAPQVRSTVAELIAAGRARLVWDLEQVTFMDSTVLGVLVYTMRQSESAGGGLRLAGTGTQVLRLLRITGMDGVVEMFPDTATATSASAARLS